MKKTRLSSVASLLAAGMLMGGCMADVGGESESEGGAAQEPNVGEASESEAVAAQGPSVGGGEALGEAQQALSNGLRFNTFSEPAGQPARADLQVWRRSNSTWYAQRTSDGQGAGWPLSRPVQPQDVPVSMNLDGDALADAVTFRPSDGWWHYRLSSTGQQAQVQWGTAGDIPTPGDFDGDGKTDVAIWRPSEGRFYIRYSNGGTHVRQWGGLGDIPVVGNYDGDTRDDMAVFRPSNGTWYYIQSSTGAGAAMAWGTVGDIPLAGDFDGDGKTDLTVFRPSNGYWYTRKSSGSPATATQFGDTCDVPLPADYDGDGKTDIGVRRMETAVNYFINSSTGAGVGRAYGLMTDVPANASTFCYINGTLGPCRAATCGPVGGIRRTAAPVAAGESHSLAVKSDGTVWAWGQNGSGQLGDGTTTPYSRSTPLPVSNLTGVVSVAAGYAHSLAVKSDGTLWAWGRNVYGQLGDGTTTDRLTPMPVLGLTGVVTVAAGSGHSLALKSDGTLWAWGRNAQGQLGDGTTTARLTPVPVPGLTGVVAVAAGERHTLAVKSDGTLWAWGYNLYGRLGNGKSNPSPQTTPQLVDLPGGVVAMGAGVSHSMAVKSDGTLWIWGWNQFGQLGTEAEFQRLTPGQLPGLPVRL